MNLKLFTIVLLTTLTADLASAHPVSFKGGVGIMSYNSHKMNELQVGYSYNHRLALAHSYLREAKSEFYIPRVNFLMKRWNETDSQANIYLSVGSGLEKFNLTNTPVHLGEFSIDWESRKYYTSLQHLYLRRDNTRNLALPLADYNHTKLRLGFAPFLADYEDLNIWFITQFDKHNEDTQIEALQFLRFYRKNVLWEIGAGFDGAFAFNFMIHL